MSDDARTESACPAGCEDCGVTVDRLRAELSASQERERATAATAARLTEAGNELADAAAALIAECATRTVALQAVHTRDLTGWSRLERAIRAWREAVRGDAPTDNPRVTHGTLTMQEQDDGWLHAWCKCGATNIFATGSRATAQQWWENHIAAKEARGDAPTDTRTLVDEILTVELPRATAIRVPTAAGGSTLIGVGRLVDRPGVDACWDENTESWAAAAPTDGPAPTDEPFAVGDRVRRVASGPMTVTKISHGMCAAGSEDLGYGWYAPGQLESAPAGDIAAPDGLKPGDRVWSAGTGRYGVVIDYTPGDERAAVRFDDDPHTVWHAKRDGLHPADDTTAADRGQT